MKRASLGERRTYRKTGMSFLFEYFGWTVQKEFEKPEERHEKFENRLTTYDSIRMAERQYASWETKPKTYFDRFKPHPMYLHNLKTLGHVEYRRRKDDEQQQS